MRIIRVILAMALVLLLSDKPWADVGVAGPFFSQGQTRLSLSAGYGEWNDRSYAIGGVGAGYYFLNGLEAGVDTEAWMGNKPHLYSFSPEARYVFYQFDQFKPYVGGFYRRSVYDTLAPLNSAGGRAGLVSPLGTHSYLSAGLVFEHYFDCDTSVYSSCSQVYPEIGFTFSY